MGSTAVAFGSTIIAGLATGVGSGIALVSKRTTSRFLSISLGFSAGVMIFVSLAELFAQSVAQLSAAWGPKPGYWGAIVGFFGGMTLIALIDRLVPPAVNPHEARAKEAAANARRWTPAPASTTERRAAAPSSCERASSSPSS